MANKSSKKESIKRKPRKKTVTTGKKTGGEKKLSDLPSYGTAKRAKKKKTGGLMASVNRRMKK